MNRIKCALGAFRESALIQQYLGGPGIIERTTLDIPAQASPFWKRVAFLTMPPGCNGIGTHRQETDELYVTLSGQGELVTDGDVYHLRPGVMTSAPATVAHSLINTSPVHPLVVLGIEIAGNSGELAYPLSSCNLLSELYPSDGFHPAYFGCQRIRPVQASANLRHAFASNWGQCTLIALPAGGHVAPYGEPGHDQLLVVVRGGAAFTLPKNDQSTQTSHSPVPVQQVAAGDRIYQSVLLPRGVCCGFRNCTTTTAPLLMLCLTIPSACA